MSTHLILYGLWYVCQGSDDDDSPHSPYCHANFAANAIDDLYRVLRLRQTKAEGANALGNVKCGKCPHKTEIQKT
jgi:hypothetical protein